MKKIMNPVYFILVLLIPFIGTCQIKLNDTLPNMGDVTRDFDISPDGSMVVYIADQDTNDVDEIYSVPIGGGAPVKLNGELLASGSKVIEFLISPDGSTVVYQADGENQDAFELFSVPIDGGTAIKISGTIDPDGETDLFKISPDNSTVVFTASQDDQFYKLFSVPIGGGTPTPLTPMQVGYSVDEILFTTDSNMVVFVGDLETTAKKELYSVSINGGAITKLNGTIPNNSDVKTNFIISPDDSQVVYVADQDTNGKNELYSVSINGGTTSKLNGTLIGGGDIIDYALSQDGNTIVYRADQDINNVRELYSVSITGGAVTKLNLDLAGDQDVDQDYLISPDSSLVVYRADQETNNIVEIYSVSINGGIITKLNDPLPQFGDIFIFRISPDSVRVIYSGDATTSATNELYSVPIGGGSVITLNGPIVTGGDVISNDIKISPDNSRVIYIAEQDTDLVREIYSVPIEGGVVTKLNGSMVNGGDIVGSDAFLLSSDSSRVVYRADQDINNVVEIYANLIVPNPNPPVAVCTNITVQLDAGGNVIIQPQDVDGGSSDAEGTITLNIDQDTFTCADIGPNIVTLTVTDGGGLTDTCVATVTVEDDLAPVSICQNITVQLDTSGNVTITASAMDGGSTDNCGIATITASQIDFDCSDVGNNNVTLTVTDVSGNSSTCTAIVTVEDVTAPIVTCMNITLELDANGQATITPASVIDTLDDACEIDITAVDITAFDCSDIGTPVTVQVFVSDTNGNSSTCTAIVTVIDALAPELICPENQTVEIVNGSQYELPDYFAIGEATAIDNCTDPITITSQDPIEGTQLDPGVHTVTLTAEDESGNISSCAFQLTVEELLGVEDTIEITSLKLFPNPATEMVYLSNPQQIRLNKLTIYDLNGRSIKSIDLQDMGTQKAISVIELASANYIVVITGEQQKVITKQLIKK